MNLRLSLNLPEDFSHLPMVRRVTREALGSFGVATQDVDDLETRVGELVANAIRHAHAHETYQLDVSLEGDQATVTVSDHGVGFSRAGVAQPGTERADEMTSSNDSTAAMNDLRFGGWGLPLIEALSDHVEYLPNHPQGTTVRASKRLHLTAEGSPV